MGDNIGGGGVEIECWREVVPVLLHEARRLTVHVQFRTLKFSMTRREFHIKLSSEEDHCFLYKAAVTQEGYERFKHYHNLEVPFEQFSAYMHQLIHAVKSGHDPGERFFINILAPVTAALPQSIEFIITQRQLGCVVQSRRLNLTFTLASDAELKEHLISCFERLKREKDYSLRRNAELEVDLSTERVRVKELEERNRYLQRELEYSQTLLKSAENITKHYENLLTKQRCQGNINSHDLLPASHLLPPAVICVDEKPTINLNNHHNSDAQVLPSLPTHLHGNGSVIVGDNTTSANSIINTANDNSNVNHNNNNNTNIVNHNNNNNGSNLDSLMSFLTANANDLLNSREEDSPSNSLNVVPSIVLPSQQHQHQPQQHPQQQQPQQQSSQLQANQSSVINTSLLSSDTKKLKGAAKRKASFHNLTNPNPANAVNSSLEQQQHHHQQQHQHQQQPPMHSGGGVLHEHLARLHEAHQQQQQQQHHQQQQLQANMPNSSSTSLINPITAINLLDDRNDMYSVGTSGSQDNSYLMRDTMMMRDYLHDNTIQHHHHDMGGHHGSLSSPLDTSNELIDRLSELNENDWNMKMEYGSDDFSMDLADVSGVDNGYSSLHLSATDSNLAANVSESEDGSPNDSRNLSFDGVLSYFKCLICDNSFTIGSSHMIQHVVDSQRCTICTEIPPFESKDDLLKHMLGHSTRVYACQYCGKENPRVHYLKIHVRSHTGEKPYTCHQCGRGFADASTWRRHERVHTGEKPYQCNICGRKIARRDNVKIHMRSHMRSKAQLGCRSCGKPFTQASNLALHERMCQGPSSSVDMKPLISTSPFSGSST